VRKVIWAISMLLAVAPLLLAGTREEERPPREILRLMDLLREWDLIKDLDVIKQMEALERADNPPAAPGSPNEPRAKVKEGQK
jgi:hypothetical protein